MSFLRYGSAEAGNPCAGDIEHAFTFGRSQSGGFLRRFLYCGLTQDEEDRPVFEGLIPLVAGSGRGEMNQRFGQPSTPARPSAGRSFPFHDTLQTDPDSGRTDGLLARLDAAGKTPKVLLTNTSAEYWSGHASLIHTTMDGSADLEPSENVRIYHYSGTQHGPGQLNLFDVDVREGPKGQQLDNSVDYRPLLRAALKNVERWAIEGVEPPASRHPRLDDGTAVPAPELEATFRSIPGVNFPTVLKHVHRADFGPDAHNGLVQPAPSSNEPYPNFVPAVDADGNEVTGIRLPDLDRAPGLLRRLEPAPPGQRRPRPDNAANWLHHPLPGHQGGSGGHRRPAPRHRRTLRLQGVVPGPGPPGRPGPDYRRLHACRGLGYCYGAGRPAVRCVVNQKGAGGGG